MSADTQQLQVNNNADASRFEIDLGGGKYAFIEYQHDGSAYIMHHTEVPSEFRGQGIAEKLAKGALEVVRAQGSRIVPLCPFVKKYLERHTEYDPLVLRR
jgi:predicted GNAT family acetyltransferase